MEAREKLSHIAYYIIIAVLSVLVMAVVPMIGTEVGLEWTLPDTTVGWIVWTISKLMVAVVNMLIFHCFMQQAKVNIKDDEHYKKAREILQKAKIHKEIMPLSPNKWTTKQYTSKGTSLFLGSIISFVGLTEAVLSFDVLTFIALAFTLTMGAIFGYINMRKAEEYWTCEFYEYAIMMENQINSEEKENKEHEREVETTTQPTTTSREE